MSRLPAQGRAPMRAIILSAALLPGDRPNSRESPARTAWRDVVSGSKWIPEAHAKVCAEPRHGSVKGVTTTHLTGVTIATRRRRKPVTEFIMDFQQNFQRFVNGDPKTPHWRGHFPYRHCASFDSLNTEDAQAAWAPASGFPEAPAAFEASVLPGVQQQPGRSRGTHPSNVARDTID